MMLIDPPVNPMSTAEDIEAWLVELRAMADAPEVREAIVDAEEWLAGARR